MPTPIEKLAVVESELNRIIRGKADVIRHLLTAFVAGGNILLDDVPGVGKTTLAKALARLVDAKFSRIQFTPDLLPADITGTSIYNPSTGQFQFRPGPVFTNILLADEINRASPRTQSALLECMCEHQVSPDGQSRILEAPFMVIATQNPIEYQGTYPLPEAQLVSATQEPVSRTNTTGRMLPAARSRNTAPTALASGAAAMARCTSASSGRAQSMTKCVMPSNVTHTAGTSGQSAGCTARGSGITVDASPAAVSAMTG